MNAHSHRPPGRLALCVIMALGLAACAGPQLDRLHGEPKSTWPYTVPADKRAPAAVDGVQRFIRTASKGEVEGAWLLLSAATRNALQLRAKVVGKRGFDLLRPPPPKAGPGERALHIADPVAMFALRDPVGMKVGPAPFPAHKPADGRTLEQKVTVSDAAGKQKVLTMRFEGLHWRIHKPGLGGPPKATP